MSIRRPYGFTLLELSIVLVLLAVVTGMGLKSGLGVIESSKKVATEQKMDAIEKALMSYRMANNRLPCPGDITLVRTDGNFGLESANPGRCVGGSPQANDVRGGSGNLGSIAGLWADHVVEGGVPVRALNLPDEYMFDGWGRRIAYAVDNAVTAPGAFLAIAPDEECGIIVTDTNHKPRTGIPATGVVNGAAYVLVSYGANGHGGRVANNVPVNAGSTNTNELQNCHCNGSGVDTGMAGGAPYASYYVQQDIVSTNSGGTNGFDDIVRFKERGQMTNYDDGYNFPPGGFRMLISDNGQYVNGLGCSAVYNTGLGAVSGGASTLGMYFTTDNNKMLNYSSGPASCLLATFTGSPYNGTLGYAQINTAVPNCPAYSATNVMAASENGYLAIYDTGTGKVRFWKESNTSNSRFAEITALTTTAITPAALGFAPKAMAFTNNGNYLVISSANISTVGTALVYWRNGNNFQKLAYQPSGGLPGTLASVAISSDGRYFGAFDNSTLSIKIWPLTTTRNDPFRNVTPTVQVSPTALSANVLSFSPDGQYIIAANSSATSYTYSQAIVMYKLTTGNNGALAAPVAVTLLSPPGSTADTLQNISSAKFSYDSNYLMIGATYTDAYAKLFRKIDALTFMNAGSGVVVNNNNTAPVTYSAFTH